MNWFGKRVSIVGLGKSNLALAKYLVRHGASIIARDQKTADELGATYDTLSQLGADFRLGDEYLHDLSACDIIFLTPGIAKDLPEIIAARENGVPISTEINLFFRECEAPIIGISGSSGKTTTTSIIGAILEASGHEVYVGGNIGRPLIEEVDAIPPLAWVVLELSSFQLELLDASPEVAVLTNISPNHLDVHGTMEAYIGAKQRLLENPGDNALLIANFDDPIVRDMAVSSSAQISWFSRREEPPEGAAVLDNRIMVGCFEIGTRTLTDICSVDDIKLLGEHNIENVLAAVATTHVLGVAPGTIREVVTSFTGVAHRLELVREARGVRFYNDSIATSPARAMAGIRSFDDPVHLIAGGYDKKLSFDELGHVILERAASVHLIGDTAKNIAGAVRQAAVEKGVEPPLIKFYETIEKATTEAYQRAAPGEVVLLSPASAGYGMFTNFEARGERFRKIVRQLTEAVETRF